MHFSDKNIILHVRLLCLRFICFFWQKIILHIRLPCSRFLGFFMTKNQYTTYKNSIFKISMFFLTKAVSTDRVSSLHFWRRKVKRFPKPRSDAKKEKKIFSKQFSRKFLAAKSGNDFCARKKADACFLLKTRVARWFIFKPKIPIWVSFWGPWNGKS
jgi:hypothetical protein